MPKTLAPLFLLALLLTGCEDRATGPETNAPDGARASSGQPEPAKEPEADGDFTIVDAAGIKALREQTAAQGKVLVIDCWATWCGSCLQMFPKLHHAMDQRGDKVRLVSLCYDENAPGGKDFVDQARQYILAQHATKDAHLAIGGDAKEGLPAALGGSWSDGVLPAVFVYGLDGQLVYEMLQTEGSTDAWVNRIAAEVDQAAN